MINHQQEKRSDGVIRLHNGREYRIHNAWSHSPGVFVRYARQGVPLERKLPARTLMAMRVVSKFREEILHQENPLVLTPSIW